jgi:hypothetical protein
MIHDESGNIRAYLQQAAEMHVTNMEIEYSVFQQQELAARELNRPFMLLKARVFPDGNQWCALYGENLQDGVCAFGDTPAQASHQFDIEWLNGKAKMPASEIFPGTYAGLDKLTIKG